MTPDQKRLARHALGLEGKVKVSYRNRYLAGAEMSAWEALVHEGLAERSNRGSQILYYLTIYGAKAALEPGESLDPEDFP